MRTHRARPNRARPRRSSATARRVPYPIFGYDNGVSKMMRYFSPAALAAVLLMLSAAHAQTDQFIGNYGCATDDTSEISDGDRTVGHNYFDLDGDLTDQQISFTISISGDGRVKVQDTFAGKSTANFSEFRIVSRFNAKDRLSIVATRQEALSDRPIVLQMMLDIAHRHYGLAITAFSASVPLLGAGEAFAIVDLKLAHCRKI